MNGTPKFKTGPWGDFLFGFILCCATLLYLFNIRYSDLWIDESFTKEVVKQPFSRMPGLLAGDFHPPFYFFALKLFTLPLGVSDYSIRLFSAAGALCTLILAGTVGRRVFGKSGALYFCFLLLTLPMLAAYAHDARMYTWGAFLTTGVFLYACLFLQTGRRPDLAWLGVFSLLAAYTHWYCLIAAGWANLFVMACLLAKKNKAWAAHLVMSLLVFVLFLPWMFNLYAQAAAAKKSFWIPPLTLQIFRSCYLDPFAMKFDMVTASWPLVAIVYGLTCAAIYRILVRRRGQGGMILGLALVIFNLTIFTGAVLSLTLKPILISRYVMTVVPLLMVPPALFFAGDGGKWLKAGLLAILFCCGIYTAVGSSYFSFGPYRKSVDHIQAAYPDIKKVLHVTEVSLGPLLTYTPAGRLNHYWLDNENAVTYTNLKAFQDLHQVKTIDEMLSPGEKFCLVNLDQSPLNRENAGYILSRSRLLKTDRVVDEKSWYKSTIVLSILQYQGDQEPAGAVRGGQ